MTFRNEGAADGRCWSYQHIKTIQTIIMNEHQCLREIVAQGGSGSFKEQLRNMNDTSADYFVYALQ
jgi:hypothetical protein